MCNTSFLSLLHSFPFDAPLVYCNPQINMAMFTSTVYGYRANCLFDPQSPISTVSPPFSIQFDIRRRNMGIPVAVVTTTGVFSCLVDLQPGAVDNVYDLRLGSKVGGTSTAHLTFAF